MNKRLNDVTPEEWDLVFEGKKKEESKDYNKTYSNVNNPPHYNQGHTE